VLGDRRNMSCLKITILILTIGMLLSPMGNVSGKPKPKHLLVETDDKGMKNDDYQQMIGGQGSFRNCFGATTFDHDYCACYPNGEICRRWGLGTNIAG